MANFCKYCGKKLEGAPCDCPEAAAEAEKMAREMVQKAMREAGAHTAAAGAQADTAAGTQFTADAQPQQHQGQQYYDQNQQPQHQPQQDQRYQQTGVPQQALQVPFTQSPLFLQVKALVIGMFRQPVATFQKALAEQNKAPQYLTGVICALFTLIIFIESLEWDLRDMIEQAFISMTGAVVLRAACAAGAFALSRRYNRQIRKSDALGLFCLSLIYDAAAALIAGICFMMGRYTDAGIVLMFGLFVQLAVHFLFVWMVVGKNMEASFRISVILLLAASVINRILLGSTAVYIFRIIAGELSFWWTNW